jgi:MoaA/NifB/PqqE/SkfB family radical SAM enzyme
MEYVNLNSLIDNGGLPSDEASALLEHFDTITPKNTLITTNRLELIRGADLVQEARKRGEKILPVRRAESIKPTVRFPKRVLLELTTACNSDCTMCPRNVLTRTIEHMDTSVAKRVIDELADVGISGLWLYNIGESLLHPDFFEILDHCRKYDTLGPIWLSTNGQILDKQIIEMLLDNPVDILNYSVNAMSAEQFSNIAPALSFETVQKNLKSLIKRKKENEKSAPLIRAQMIEIPSVKHEINLFLEEYGSEVDLLSINKLESFSQNVPANTDAENNVRNHEIDKCNRLDREDFFIFADGSVSCCDTDFNCTLNIGSVCKNSVQDIFTGGTYQGILAKYADGTLHELDLCSKCGDFSL